MIEQPSETATRIERRAYEIWEQEGRPSGRHDDHWERARAEIEEEGRLDRANGNGAHRPSRAKGGRRRKSVEPWDGF